MTSPLMTPLPSQCRHYDDGFCDHPFAPSRWFSLPKCIHLEPNSDPRRSNLCVVVSPLQRPRPPAPPPLSGKKRKKRK